MAKRTAPERLEMSELAAWVLATSSFGVALLRDGTRILANVAWHRANGRGAPPQSWEMRGIARRRFPTLDAAAAAIGQALGDVPSTVVRLRRSPGGAAVDLHLERVAGVPLALVAIVVDATDRERHRRIVRNSRRLRSMSAFARPIAHELKNTFHALSLRIRLVQRMAMDASIANAIDDVDAAVRKALELTERLHVFSNLSRRSVPAGVDPAALVDQAVEIVRAEIASRESTPMEVEIRRKAMPPVAATTVDVLDLLSTLLVNAHGAMPTGGLVRISMRHVGDRVILRVCDEGPRIPASDLRHLFDPFFHPAGRRTAPLGLAATWASVTRLGGNIRAFNLKSGGVAFELALPVAEGAALEKIRDLDRSERRRILLVDDDVTALEHAASALRQLGHAVDVASGGRRAIELLAASIPYDLVLSDLHMPGIDGWHVAQEARKRRPSARVYLLTGFAAEIRRRHGARTEADGFLSKPIDLAEFAAALAAPASRSVE